MELKMVTKTSHEYAGKNLAPGDEFDAESQAHVDLLTALGRAELKQTEQPQGSSGRARRARGTSLVS